MSFASAGDVRTIMAVLYLLGDNPADASLDKALEPVSDAAQRAAVARSLTGPDRAQRARALASYLAPLIHAIDEWSLT